MCHVENEAVAQLRITPAGKSHSEIVCLVDDDPAALKSLKRLLVSEGLSARSFNKLKSFLAHVQAHSIPFSPFFTKSCDGPQFLSAACGALPLHLVQ